jgi:hypothetical protein
MIYDVLYINLRQGGGAATQFGLAQTTDCAARGGPACKRAPGTTTRTPLYIRRRNRACCADPWHVASCCNTPLRAFGAHRPARRGATAPARRFKRGEPSPSRQGCHDARGCARASVWRAQSRCRCAQGRAQSRCRHGQGVSPGSCVDVAAAVG